MAYDWADDPVGRGTIVWAGPVYCRVLLDTSGRRVVVRIDKCRRLVRKLKKSEKSA